MPTPVRGQSPAPSLPPGAVAGSISANHPAPHLAVITAAQLAAGDALDLDIRGDAFHSHVVSLTSVEVAQIARRMRTATVSSRNPHSDGTDAHSHGVTFN